MIAKTLLCNIPIFANYNLTSFYSFLLLVIYFKTCILLVIHFKTCIFVIGIDYITRNNFLTELDNGVILCHLAQQISERAKGLIEAGLIKGVRKKSSLVMY